MSHPRAAPARRPAARPHARRRCHSAVAGASPQSRSRTSERTPSARDQQSAVELAPRRERGRRCCPPVGDLRYAGASRRALPRQRCRAAGLARSARWTTSTGAPNGPASRAPGRVASLAHRASLSAPPVASAPIRVEAGHQARVPAAGARRSARVRSRRRRPRPRVALDHEWIKPRPAQRDARSQVRRSRRRRPAPAFRGRSAPLMARNLPPVGTRVQLPGRIVQIVTNSIIRSCDERDEAGDPSREERDWQTPGCSERFAGDRTSTTPYDRRPAEPRVVMDPRRRRSRPIVRSPRCDILLGRTGTADLLLRGLGQMPEAVSPTRTRSPTSRPR